MIEPVRPEHVDLSRAFQGRFETSEDGAIAPIFGLVLMGILGLAGIGIDTTRWNHVHSRTLAALDGAVLAAARRLQVEDDAAGAIAVATKFYNEQVKERLPVVNDSVTFQITANNTRIEAEALATVATPMLTLFNLNGLPLRVTSKAAFSVGSMGGGTDIEIALMLDVTGSMCANGIGPCTSSAKLDALKDGAEDLVKIIVKENQGATKARVALVPFSTRVRVGVEGAAQPLMKTLTDLDPTWTGWNEECTSGSGSGGSEDSGNWTCNATASIHRSNMKIMPCVTDRTGPGEYTDDAPGPNYWLNAHDGGRAPRSWDSSDTALTTWTGISEADPASQWNYENGSANGGYCADVAEANAIVPLSPDRNMLRARIQGLEAYGSTAGALGTAWAWYMLSENWAGVWGGQSTPGPYADLAAVPGGKPKLRKVAVLMTDGLYNTFRNWKDADPVEVSDRAKQICTNMKQKGIEIFTVGFDLDSLPPADKARAMATLTHCGTDLDHFYNTLDTEELQQAFRDIALSLSHLYIDE